MAGHRQRVVSAWHQANASCPDLGHSAATRDPFPTHPALLLSSPPPLTVLGWGSTPALLRSRSAWSQRFSVREAGQGPAAVFAAGKCSWSLVFCSVAGPFVFIAYRFCRGALKGCHCSNGCFRFASIKPRLMKTSLRSSFS